MLRLFFLLAILGHFSVSACAGNSKDFNSFFSASFSSPSLEMLSDDVRDLSIEQVSAAPYSSQFIELTREQLHQGFTNRVIWVRLKLDEFDSSASPLFLEFDYPLIDLVTLFQFKGGKYQSRTSGDRVPFNQRDINYRNPVFILEPETLGSKTIYLRLETEGSMPLDLRIWSPVAFSEYLGFSQLWFGAYYGLIFVLAMAALVVFIYLRSTLFLTYSLYLASYLLLQMALNGFAFQYLWPNQTWWATHSTVLLIMSPLVFGLLLAGKFLGIWDGNGWIRLIFKAVILLALPVVFIGMAVDYSLGVRMAIGLSIIMMPSVALAAIAASLRGLRPARLFLFAYSFFLGGTLTTILTYLGIIPYHFFTINAIQVGSVFEVLFLSMALAHRMRVLVHAKDEAQARATHYMHRMNNKLEQLVENRTHALVESNMLLREQATRDSLTGVLNHRAILERLDEELEAAKRYGNPIAVVMLDLDYFKQLNDRFGHQAGDTILLKVAHLLDQSMRKSDHCGRYGGEEFLMILSHVSRLQAMEWAERIRLQIADIALDTAPHANCTCSLGVAVYLPDQEIEISSEKLITLADSLLYKSKQEGRNRVSIAVTRDAESYGIDLVERDTVDPAG